MPAVQVPNDQEITFIAICLQSFSFAFMEVWITHLYIHMHILHIPLSCRRKDNQMQRMWPSQRWRRLTVMEILPSCFQACKS